MVSEIAGIGFGVTAAGYLVLMVVVSLAARRNPAGMGLVAAAAASALWASGHAVNAFAVRPITPAWLAGIEALRYAGWFAFLLTLLRADTGSPRYRMLMGLAAGLVACQLLVATALHGVPGATSAGGAAAATFALILLQNVWRGADTDARWALKFLCVGLMAAFIYDLIVFAAPLMADPMGEDFRAARGLVNALVVPMLAIAAARRPTWAPLDLRVSRRMALHAIAIGAAVAYLALALISAWGMGEYAGHAGRVLGIAFLVAATLGLVVVLLSGQLRARVRVFLNKHFYNYRYDYREETLRFTATLSGDNVALPMRQRVIRAIAQIVDSPAGILYQRRNALFVPTAAWNLPLPQRDAQSDDGPLARFMEDSGWILETEEWRRSPGRYRDIPVPEWMAETPRAWLLVPLLRGERLEAMVLLTRSRAGRVDVNWEDFDLLRTLGRHAATYLAQEDAAEALVTAQQFEAFNRLSAFVVHDLKNVIGQLSMLARNARRHRGNPAFVADAIETVDHAVERMRHLLAQLRGDVVHGRRVVTDLARIVRQTVRGRSGEHPVPEIEIQAGDAWARVDRARMIAVLGHLIQNAQEATAADEGVRVRLARDGRDVVIDVIDSGSGMTPEFVRDRLFRPFDTSKGSAGMGIGAFEAREFIRGLGGQLEVDSTPGRGTRMRIRLPEAVLSTAPQEKNVESDE